MKLFYNLKHLKNQFLTFTEIRLFRSTWRTSVSSIKECELYISSILLGVNCRFLTYNYSCDRFKIQ
jgi:hypothetical protein